MNEVKNLVTGSETKKEEKGASLVEYALLVALIAVVCIVAVTALGTAASKKLSIVSSAVSN